MCVRIRPTTERRRERYEFVYKFRNEIERLIRSSKKEIRDFVESHARKELFYKSSTYYMDIFLTLRRDFNKIFNKKW